MRLVRNGAAALLAATVAACVPRAAPPAPAPIPPAARPLPPPGKPPAPPPVDWQEAEPSPGDWEYLQEGAVTHATFRSDRLVFTLHCARSRSVNAALSGAQAPALIIRTSYGERRLPVTPGHIGEMMASLSADDPLLDQMAFSRGRLLVQAEGGAALIVPAWPEIARVTEDCRDS